MTVAVGMLFGGEKLSAPLVLGALLVLLGVYIGTLWSPKPRPDAARNAVI